MENHEQISAEDKDFAPAFLKLCQFVTVDLIKMGVLLGEFEQMYSDEEMEALVSNDVIETVREDQWLDDVYGTNSRMHNQDWLQKVVKDGNWLFVAKDLRKRVFKAAEIDYKM